MKNKKLSTSIFALSYYLFIIIGCLYLKLNPDYHFFDEQPLSANNLFDNILLGFVLLAIILIPAVSATCDSFFEQDRLVEKGLLDYYKLKLEEMNALESKYFEDTEALNKLNEKKSFLNTQIGYIAHACALLGNISINEAKELVNDESITNLTFFQGSKPWLNGLLSFINSEYAQNEQDN